MWVVVAEKDEDDVLVFVCRRKEVQVWESHQFMFQSVADKCDLQVDQVIPSPYEEEHCDGHGQRRLSFDPVRCFSAG